MIGADMSQYTAWEETRRRPSTRCSQMPNPVVGEKENPLIPTISPFRSRKLKAKESPPPVSRVRSPLPARKRKSPLAVEKRKLIRSSSRRINWAKDPEVFADDPPKAAEEEIPLFETPPSSADRIEKNHRFDDLEVFADDPPKAAEEEIPLFETPPSPADRIVKNHRAEDPEIFAGDLPVMDGSCHFNYLQHPVAHQYKAAEEEIRRVETLPSSLDSQDRGLKLVSADRIEKNPRAKDLVVSYQTEDASSAMKHVVPLGNPFAPASSVKNHVVPLDNPFAPASSAMSHVDSLDNPFSDVPLSVDGDVVPLGNPFEPASEIYSPSYSLPEFSANCKLLTVESYRDHIKHYRGYSKSEQLAMDHQLVMDCLRHYNSRCMGVEYEPAPGEVTRRCEVNNGTVWFHGNFVARRKRSGLFSFLPGPRTLFFFEVVAKKLSREVITCTPLLDEPVTGTFSVLCCPLWWWSTRRSGKYDTICKTCKRCLDKGILACGHEETEELCKMCYRRTDVLHPSSGEFTFGNK